MSSVYWCMLKPYCSTGRTTSAVYSTNSIGPRTLSSLLCCRPDGLELYQTGSETRLSAAAISGNYSRWTLQPLLSTLSAVEMLYDSALYKYTIDIDIEMSSLGWEK